MRSLPLSRPPLPPRPPFGPDPLRRIRVPKDLDAVTSANRAAEVDGEDTGMRPGGVERIWRSVQRLYRSGMYPAIALCVRREGEVVLDRAIGHAEGNGPHDDPDTPKTLHMHDTPQCIFSASKAVAATVAHMLDQRGVFHIDDRVAEYIPEYAAHGKHVITIEHVLSHRAGVPNIPPDALDLDKAMDREYLVDVLCKAKPSTRPGKLLAYHAISGGFIVGEIVQRVTGKDIRTVLAEEILDPLGFRWGNFGVARDDVPLVAPCYPTGPVVLPPVSTLLTRALGRSPDEVTRLSNDPRFLTAIVPAANVVTTANELSRFMELLRAGGTLDGVEILEPRTIRRATAEKAYRELDLTLGAPMRHAAGFMLGAEAISLFGPDTEYAFGHLGFTNVLAWADPERGLSVGLLTSGKPVIHPALPDLWGLARRIGLEAPKIPGATEWFRHSAARAPAE